MPDFTEPNKPNTAPLKQPAQQPTQQPTLEELQVQWLAAIQKDIASIKNIMQFFLLMFIIGIVLQGCSLLLR